MEDIFINISLIISLVFVICFFTRLIKQPLIIGYIISGIIAGPIFLNIIPDEGTISTFAEMGISFLLFIVGLHLSPKVIKDIGVFSLFIGISQILFTTVIGYFISLALGFSRITALYLAIALSFSSTIIIMKLLYDKEALEKLYGKISIGVLLIQDLVAIASLLFISSLSNGNIYGLITNTLLKGIILFIVLIPLSIYILPKFTYFFAKSQEFLFIFAISWGLGLASLFNYLGFSLEVGALIAGIILSMTPYSYEISSKLRSLRDFFVISFFILLGSQMILFDINNLLIPIIVLSIFILVGKPLIIFLLMTIFGYTKNTSFMSGTALAQISEFSLILISLGIKVGHIPQETLSLITALGIITIAGSSYMILLSEKIYSYLEKPLNLIGKRNIKEKKIKIREYKYFLLGENRIGYSIMKSFKKTKRDFLVIDYNPETIKRLALEKINCLYGDVSDIDFLDSINFTKSKIIVSTIPDLETNLIMLKEIRKINKSSVIIITSNDILYVKELYNAGADYVVLTHFLGGNYIANIIENLGENKNKYKNYKLAQLKELKERINRGHTHPKIEKNK
ncbi:MAG: cation:proton antiporter family protein [Nanoarchaeota archaeon]